MNGKKTEMQEKRTEEKGKEKEERKGGGALCSLFRTPSEIGHPLDTPARPSGSETSRSGHKRKRHLK